MTHKKTYSRIFIILQEFKSGYGVTEDKEPNGYVKVEVKNNKCRVCFYVQNLKNISNGYNMALISKKGNEGKLIDIGKVKLDGNGKCETSVDYPLNNIANMNMDMELVKGAAIISKDGIRVKPVLCGFPVKGEIDGWEKFKLLGKNSTDDNEKVLVEPKKDSGKEKKKEDKVDNIVEDKHKNHKANNKVQEKHKEVVENKESCTQDIKPKGKIPLKGLETKFDEYEKNINIENKNIDHKHMDKEEKVHDHKHMDKEEKVHDHKHMDMKEKVHNHKDEGKKEKVDNHKHADKHKIPELHMNIKDKDQDKEFLTGQSGEFFTHLVKGLEEVPGIFKAIKNTKWFKVRIKCLDDFYYVTDQRKYSMIYYPMINNFPYIARHEHYLFGYKKDNDGRLKYILYAVPGTKNKFDQPYSGKTGYVLWMPLDPDDKSKDAEGYWIMFYEYETSTVCIPKKDKKSN